MLNHRLPITGGVTLSVAALLCAVGVGSTLTTANGSHNPTAKTASNLAPKHSSAYVGMKGDAHPMPCGSGESPIYFIAQLSSEGSATALLSDGFQVVSLTPTASESPAIVMVNPRKTDGTAVTTQALEAEPGVDSAGSINPQSSNPDLLSCDYTLSDQPADAPLVQAAKTALASSGLATTAAMNGEAAIYMVGDDPLNAADNVLTIDTS